ncbi:MAG TPA: diadenylate cyclase [Bacilli bacterium]|nr:diadenylate cyclase [Bacilli bacterium]
MREELDLINENVYRNLCDTLKRLNRQFHLKYYVILIDDGDKVVETVRVKKTISEEAGYKVRSDILPNMDRMFQDLQIEKIPSNEPEKLFDTLRTSLNQSLIKSPKKVEEIVPRNQTNEIERNGTIRNLKPNSNSSESRILYANKLHLKLDEKEYSAIYLLEIRNLDEETIHLFYKKPDFSFLRMILDYYFVDYYSTVNEAIELNESRTLETRFKEDITLFTRRMARVFMGKLYRFLQNDYKSDGKLNFVNKVDPAYYMNDLFEKIDDISNKTYETSSPFGSILFCSRNTILGTDAQRIKFAIKFLEDEWIDLDDSKRIRKLLELTDGNQELHLIADHQYVYGVGEVDWGLMQSVMAIKLSFKGLSKYELALVNLDEKSKGQGRVITDGENKLYQYNVSLGAETLVSISFKNPKLGEDHYSSKKLVALLRSQLYGKESSDSKSIEIITDTIRKARKQKHGTMVVITDTDTARNEIQRLKKQSTLIEPRKINPDHIKYLTSIDGAIYFDQSGACYGIGVILDGIANGRTGDASRGARYNSANRYWEKLTEDEKKCVIAVISEDGMVNLIPELDNEEKISGLVEEIIDSIKDQDDQLERKEQELARYESVEYDRFFEIASAFYNVGNVMKAFEYCERGIQSAGDHQFIPFDFLDLRGDVNFALDSKEGYETAIQTYQKAAESVNRWSRKSYCYEVISISYYNIIVQVGTENNDFYRETVNKALDAANKAVEITINSGGNANPELLNIRGRCLYELASIEEDQLKGFSLLTAALSDCSKAIEFDPSNHDYYWDRSLVNESLDEFVESINDAMCAEVISSSRDYLNHITDILESNKHLWPIAISNYHKLAEERKQSSDALQELINQYESKIERENQVDEEAAPVQEM